MPARLCCLLAVLPDVPPDAAVHCLMYHSRCAACSNRMTSHANEPSHAHVLRAFFDAAVALEVWPPACRRSTCPPTFLPPALPNGNR